MRLDALCPAGWSRLDMVAYFIASVLASTSGKRCSMGYLEKLVIGSADDVGENISPEEYRAGFVVAAERRWVEQESMAEEEGILGNRLPSLPSTDGTPWVRSGPNKAWRLTELVDTELPDGG